MQALTAPPSQRSENDLLRLARGGDRQAAEELVECTYNSVYASLCRMCGDSDLAADLTQETYRKAWEAFGEFDQRSRFFTWLYRIAYTTFLNHVRRPARVIAVEEPPEMADPAARPEELTLRTESFEILRKAVLALPDELRFTVMAHFWGDLAVKEIAELEGITTAGVRKRLERAYSSLQPAMETR